VLAQCKWRLSTKSDLNAYTSANNAADIIDLADALGYQQYNLYGVSYGTRLALTAMRDAPQRIRSVVLDSTFPPQAHLYVNHAVNLERSLDALFDACASDATCRSVAPNLRGTFFNLVAQLDAEPAEVLVQDFASGGVGYMLVDGGGLLEIMFHSFYDTSLIPALPMGIMQVARGDTRMLSALASGSSRFNANWSLGMYLSVQCHEEAPFNAPDAVAAASTARLTEDARASARSFIEECAAWGVPAAGAHENAAVTSDIPALVLAGQLDPITPPSYGREAAATLPRATFVEFAGFGHAVLSAGCPMDIVVRFLDDPAAPPDTSCSAAMPPLVFATP
jgi:pimeloyl-ACP methyl ester carboxylesterase